MDYRKFNDEEIFEFLSDVTKRYTQLLHKSFATEEFKECKKQLDLLITEASRRIKSDPKNRPYPDPSNRTER